MKTASGLINATDKASVEAAIASAEKLTAGEIVPVVATASGRYDRAEDLFGMVFAIICLTVIWFGFQGSTDLAWSSAQGPALGLGLVIVVLIVAFGIGAALATRFPALGLPFVSREEMLEEVERRALEVFQRAQLRKTAGGTGVLIYVSLFERLVKVVADDRAAEKLPDEALNEICDLVVNGLKLGHPADGLINAIKKTGEVLAPHLPPAADDTNELANQLLLLD